MYAYIKVNFSIISTHIVVENNGIGYEIQTPNSYRFQSTRRRGASLYTTNCTGRRASIIWFGDLEEKDMF